MNGLIRREVYARRSERPNDIADRKHSDQRLAINDRQVTDSVAGHQLHARANRSVRGHADDVLGHDVLDEDIPWSNASRHRLSDVVSLGKNADQIRTPRHR